MCARGHWENEQWHVYNYGGIEMNVGSRSDTGCQRSASSAIESRQQLQMLMRDASGSMSQRLQGYQQEAAALPRDVLPDCPVRAHTERRSLQLPTPHDRGQDSMLQAANSIERQQNLQQSLLAEDLMQAALHQEQ